MQFKRNYDIFLLKNTKYKHLKKLIYFKFERNTYINKLQT